MEPSGDPTKKTDTATCNTMHYHYDVFGNPRTVDPVDGRNRRVGKRVDGELVQGFLYKDALNPIVEKDGAGEVVAVFHYGAKPNVPAYMEKNGRNYRIISDHLGSVRLVLDAETGEVVQRMEYTPFGEVTTDTNPGFQPFGFAGGLYDADTGLVRFGARDYDPHTGRWTAKDPMLFRGRDTNLYGYSVSDPINLVDPVGLAWFRPDGHPYLAGREGTIVEPGRDANGELNAGGYIDDYVPAGHTFASMHDRLVGYLTEFGVPDWLGNVPMMLPIYSVALSEELFNSFFSDF
jgi:RHS repeat-associated protein